MYRSFLFAVLMALISGSASAQTFQKAILRRESTGTVDSLRAGQKVKLWVLDTSGKEKIMRGVVERISPDTLYLRSKRGVALNRIEQIQYRPKHVVWLIFALFFFAYIFLGVASMLSIVAIAEPVSLDVALLLVGLGFGTLIAGLVLSRSSRHRFSDFRNNWRIEVVESPPVQRAVQIP